ncbi:hypothetical protein P4283_26265 [Bacillus thuringiensis]|nr:hypothetical protein [Bacillus thuringiensis]
MDNQSLEIKVDESEKRMSDLQRGKDNLVKTIHAISKSIGSS